MSDQLQTQVNNMQQQLNEVAVKVGQGETAHKNLKESIDETKGMIRGLDDKWEKWRGDMESQVHAIAQAVLQDQARDDVEKEVEQKSEVQAVQKENKWLTWKTTIAVCGFGVVANIGEVIKFFAKLFNLLAG